MTAEPACIRLPDLYPLQRTAFFGSARMIICDASTKAGKSVGALAWCLSRGFGPDLGRSGLFVSMTCGQAEVMLDRLIRILRRSGLAYGRDWTSNRSKMWIGLGAGRLYFKGGDRPDTIYGTDYSYAVIDEASRCKAEVYHAVESTLTATGGPVRVIGNVKGRSNWAYLLGQRAKSGEPGMAYAKITAIDAVEAGVLSAEIVEDARRKLPDHVFRELYMAEPSDDGGNPFGVDAIQRCITNLSDDAPVVWGVDLGKSQDYTVAIALDARGRVCRFERWLGVPWHETTARLVALIGETRAIVDSTGVGDPIVESLQRSLPQVEGRKFTATSKQQMMEGLAAAIHGGEVGYPEGPIVSELLLYEYSHGRTHVSYSAPPNVHDDCVCALALALSGRSSGEVYVPRGEVSVVRGHDKDFDFGGRLAACERPAY